MEIISMNDILRRFHTAKLNLNDDGTRSKEYHQIMKKKWFDVDELMDILSKFKSDTPLSVIISALHDEGLTKEPSDKLNKQKEMNKQ